MTRNDTNNTNDDAAAVSFASHLPGVTFLGVSQLDDAIASLEIELADEDIAEMEAPYVPRRASELGRPSLRA